MQDSEVIVYARQSDVGIEIVTVPGFNSAPVVSHVTPAEALHLSAKLMELVISSKALETVRS
jgi:hypothetical protein